MKRSRIIIVALVAALAIGSVSIATAAKNANDQVKTKLSLGYDPGGSGPYGESAKFSGRAKAKRVCRGNRKVTITDVGKAKTDKNGRFVIDADGTAPGTYQASAKKKIVKKNGKKVVCKKAKSPKVTIG